MAIGRFRAFFPGDSVIWGQGLQESDKFSTLIINWINQYHPSQNPAKIVTAHSGAIIGVNAAVGRQPRDGEVPFAFPTILEQCDSFQGDPDEIDLVVVNGGINDVNIRNIFNPFTDSDELDDRIRRHCYVNLKGLLHRVAGRFTNVRTRILVLGYYPVLSHESDPLRIPIMVQVCGVGIASFFLPRNPVARITDNSIRFWNNSSDAIRKAVEEVNQETGSARFVFVRPAFQPANAAFGPQPWVFGIKANSLPQDDAAGSRAVSCLRDEPDPLKREICFRASAGHPNKWGAKAYFNAIYPVLQREFGF